MAFYWHPLKLMWAIVKHQFIWKKIISLLRESLSKDICYLKIAKYMRKKDSLSFNIDMFIAFVEDGISWNMNGTSIIHMQRNKTTWREAKFNQYPWSQCVSLKAWYITLYLDSVKDLETWFCFLLFQEIRVGPWNIHQPKVERWVSL